MNCSELPIFMALLPSDSEGIYSKEEIVCIRKEQLQLANLISKFEPITVIANQEDVDWLQKLFASNPNQNVIEVPHDDIWLGDIISFAPLHHSKNPCLIDFCFRGYLGERHLYQKNMKLVQNLSKKLSLPVIRSKLTIDRGSFEYDHDGTAIISNTILDSVENKGLSKKTIEDEMRLLLDVQKVIWLDSSLSYADKITKGHISNNMSFIKPGVLAVMVSDDPTDEDYEILIHNINRLDQKVDAKNRRFEITPFKRPRKNRMPPRGEFFSDSYTNFLTLQGKVLVMPAFSDLERDEEAKQKFLTLFPGYKIITISLDTIFEQGGGLLCLLGGEVGYR